MAHSLPNSFTFQQKARLAFSVVVYWLTRLLFNEIFGAVRRTRDEGLAVQFINCLSKAYRYILEQRGNEQVSLRTELDFIAAYTFLLTIRFKDKLFVTIDVPEVALDRYAIAPLTLQLLVENAVKRNRLSEEEPLRVNIALENNCLRVSNPLQVRPDRAPSTGFGLENITNRYQLLSDQSVWIGEEEGEFVVNLPLLN